MTFFSDSSKGKSAPFLVLASIAALTLTACGGGGEQAEPEPMEEAAAVEPMAESSSGPRVFFVTPEDGATVSSPVSFEFGHENFMIEARGDGEIHEGAGHHHIGGRHRVPSSEHPHSRGRSVGSLRRRLRCDRNAARAR